jgi:hypothetical protein
MAEDPGVSHDMSTTLPGGYFGPSPDALKQIQQQNAAYNDAYQKKLRANQEWYRRQQQQNMQSHMSYGLQPNTGRGMQYKWTTNPGVPYGPPPDAPQEPMPYPEMGFSPGGLPHFQQGGTSWGGPAVVGENGPEVVDLPPGSDVYPTNPDDTPYWQRGGGYSFNTPPPAPPLPSYGPGYGAVSAYRPPMMPALTPSTDMPVATQHAASLGFNGPDNSNPANVPQVPGPVQAGIPGVPGVGPGYATSPYGGSYFNYELANWLAQYGISLANLTGTYQATGPDGKPIGNAEPTYAANLGLSGLFGYGITNGMPTLAGRIAEDTRQQNVANFLGNTFGGTGSGYRPGRDNVGPSRQFTQFIDNSMKNPADEIAWNSFVQYMQANLDPTRFGIIMRGEQVGNPTKGEQALMAGVMRRKGASAPVMTDTTGGV